MPPLEIIVIGFIVLRSARLEVILLVAVPSRIVDDVLVDCTTGRVTRVFIIPRLYFVLSELQEGLEGWFALVGKIVRNAPIYTLGENIIWCQSVHRETQRDL